MVLQKETTYGKITIAERVFAEILLSILEEEEFKDRIWAANKRGRIIQKGAAFAENDIASMLHVERGEDERLILNLAAVVKFGESIKATASKLSDRMAELIKKHDGRKPKRITIEVTGVKGATLQKRSMEIVREYED